MTEPGVVTLYAISCIALAFLISLVTTPFAIWVSKRSGVMDVPVDDRRMHKQPTPRLGGIAIFISFSVCTIILCALIGQGVITDPNAEEMLGKLTAVLASGALIFALGVVDDARNVRPLIKLTGQIGCAAVCFVMGIRIPAIALFGWHFAGAGGIFISFIVTIIWIVAITNMINLIDGLDGLAAGVAGIASLAIAYSAYINGYQVAAFAMAILAGAALGFLPLNFYPAKVFMGDSGAMYLGFMIASVSIISPAKGATIVAIIAPVIVLGVPVFDITFAMIRRKIRGKSMFEADKGHLHHQLTRIGIGQRRSALMLYGVSGIMGIAAIVFSRDLYLEAIGLFLIAIIFIVVLIWGWNKNDS